MSAAIGDPGLIVLDKILRFLATRATREREMFFRVPDLKSAQTVDVALDAGLEVDFGRFDVHAVGAVFRRRLRDAKVPVIPSETAAQLISLQEGEPGNRAGLQGILFSGVPPASREFLKNMFRFLNQLCSNASSTLATSLGLAANFAPLLFKEAVGRFSAQQITEIMIVDASAIFESVISGFSSSASNRVQVSAGTSGLPPGPLPPPPVRHPLPPLRPTPGFPQVPYHPTSSSGLPQAPAPGFPPPSQPVPAPGSRFPATTPSSAPSAGRSTVSVVPGSRRVLIPASLIPGRSVPVAVALSSPPAPPASGRTSLPPSPDPPVSYSVVPSAARSAPLEASSLPLRAETVSSPAAPPAPPLPVSSPVQPVTGPMRTTPSRLLFPSVPVLHSASPALPRYLPLPTTHSDAGRELDERVAMPPPLPLSELQSLSHPPVAEPDLIPLPTQAPRPRRAGVAIIPPPLPPLARTLPTRRTKTPPVPVSYSKTLPNAASQLLDGFRSK